MTAEANTVSAIEVAPAESGLNCRPFEIVASATARSNESAPTSEPIAALRNQPRCRDQPNAEKGSFSNTAPQAQPVSVADANKTTPPNRNQNLSPLRSDRLSEIVIAKKKIERRLLQIRKATAKTATRQPLRTRPWSSTNTSRKVIRAEHSSTSCVGPAGSRVGPRLC